MALMVNNNDTRIIRRNKHGKKVEMVPPDGGWGYMICLSLITIFVGQFGPMTAFGLVFNDFFISIGEGSSGLAAMNTICSIVASITSMATTALLKRYTLRQVSIFASATGVVGNLFQVFMRTMYEMIFAQVLITICAYANIVVVYTAFNSYFTKKRVVLLSTCKAIIGISYTVFPFIVQWFMDQFGFRGTLLLITALAMNGIVGSLLLQPVKWHLVEEEITEEEEMNKYDSQKIGSNIKINIIDPDGKVTNNNEEKEKIANTADGLLKPSEKLLIHSKGRRLSGTVVKLSMMERRQSMPVRTTYKGLNYEETKSINDHLEAVSLLSLGGFESSNAMPVPIPIATKKSLWQTIQDMLDLSLLKDVVYLNIAIGMSLTLFSESLFMIMFPLMLFQLNFTADQVALCLALNGAGDTISRFMLAFSSRFISLNPRYVFFCGVVIAIMFRIGLDLTVDFYAVAIISAGIGVAKCFTHLMIPLILSDHVSIEKYPAAYGLQTLLFGAFNLVLGPAIGILRDVTQSYNITFDVLNGAFVICAVSWLIEFILTRNKKKNKEVEK